jgi:hypothetical protein
MSQPPSLFEVRTRTGSVAYTTPTYKVLDERSGPLWDAVRATLDYWFVRLPLPARDQIRSRFASSKEIVHLGAFWELYLHEAFLRLGFDIDVDIGRDAEEGRRRPDLLVRRGDAEFYVEATAVTGDDVLTPQQRQLLQQLRDVVNGTRSSDFLVALDVIEYGPSTPSQRHVVAPLERWLGGLDHDGLLEAERMGARPRARMLEFAGWRVRIEAMPLKSERRGQDGHGILGYTGEDIGELDDVSPILRKLKRKAHHYGELDRPFVIALLCAGTFVEPQDIEAALFGPIVGAHGPKMAFKWVRERNGLWMRPNGPTNTRVSAVLTAIGLSTTAITAVEPCWWTNPWARQSISADLPWECVEANDRGRTIGTAAARTSAAMFELPERWPAISA